MNCGYAVSRISPGGPNYLLAAIREAQGLTLQPYVPMVVDPNMLREEALRLFLRRSRRHQAVLTDYAAMEAYKADSLATLRNSIAILAEFPDQVLVLKNTQTLCSLNARGAGLRRRLIDERQTREFTRFCYLTKHAADHEIRLQFEEHVREAQAQMDRMLADAGAMAESIALFEKAYTNTELRNIRTDERYTSEMIKKLITSVSELARLLIVRHPRARKFRKGTEEPRNNFIFRVALCAYLVVLRWIAVGGARSVKPEKLRNDMIDANFAACATYFDGLLSSDKKLMSIYQEAKAWLEVIFVPINVKETNGRQA